MADIDLPVFSFLPNWREGVTERLSFLTDIMRAKGGAEQRRSTRTTPRRTLEADFLLRGAERTFFELFLDRFGGDEFMAPLYWNVVSIPAALTMGVTDRIDFDTTGTEYAVGLALLIRDKARSFEVVEITAVDAGGVDLSGPVFNPWPVGTSLMPLRRAVFMDAGALNQLSGGVGDTSVQLQFVVPNPWTPAADSSPVYGGLPVLLSEPNWRDGVEIKDDKMVSRLDNETGLPFLYDSAERTFVGQSHDWFLHGRAALAGFRDLIYRHGGRRGSFWLPTFTHDFKVVENIGSGDSHIDVEDTGFGYVGGPTSGKEYIAVKHDGGTILRKIISVVPGPDAGTERLGLDAPMGLALSTGQVRRISFADVGRFDQDDFEIIHYAGIDGLHECQTRFQTFKSTREITGPLLLPTALEAMSSSGCGSPEIDNPCAAYYPTFDGWYWRFWVEWEVGGLADNAKPGLFFFNVNGVSFNYAVSLDAYHQLYESNDPGGPYTDPNPVGMYLHVVNQTSFGLSGRCKIYFQHWTWSDRRLLVSDDLEPGSDFIYPDGSIDIIGVFPRHWDTYITEDMAP